MLDSVNTKHNRLLHIVLILLLIISPLRSAFAMQLMPCEMGNMADDTMVNMAVSSYPVSHHVDMHTMHVSTHVSQMDASHQHHIMPSESKQANTDQYQCCCCDDGSNCMGNCDPGINVSLIIHISAYAPVLIRVTQAPLFSTDVVIRELTPPSRPPAILYS